MTVTLHFFGEPRRRFPLNGSTHRKAASVQLGTRYALPTVRARGGQCLSDAAPPEMLANGAPTVAERVLHSGSPPCGGAEWTPPDGRRSCSLSEGFFRAYTNSPKKSSVFVRQIRGCLLTKEQKCATMTKKPPNTKNNKRGKKEM